MNSRALMRLWRAGAQHGERTVTAKTADYTLTGKDYGKIFTNRGATGAVTFTLPTPKDRLEGATVIFYVVADQTVTVTGPDEKLTVYNDATADSVAFSTASEKIGSSLECVWDGTTWLVIPRDWTDMDNGTVTQITSITTAVASNTMSGQITTVSSTLAGGAEATFTVNNTKVAATDTVVANLASTSSAGLPVVVVSAVAANSFDITITNLDASALDNTMVINFVVVRAGGNGPVTITSA